VNADRRGEIRAGLKEKGIPTGVYYPKCFHEQPVFEHLGYEVGDFPVSEKASDEVLSLPMHPFLTKDIKMKLQSISLIYCETEN